MIEQFFTTLRLFVCIVLPPAAVCFPFRRPPHSLFNLGRNQLTQGAFEVQALALRARSAVRQVSDGLEAATTKDAAIPRGAITFVTTEPRSRRREKNESRKRRAGDGQDAARPRKPSRIGSRKKRGMLTNGARHPGLATRARDSSGPVGLIVLLLRLTFSTGWRGCSRT